MVMRAGNIGRSKASIALEAGAQVPEVRLVIVGEGSGHSALVELASRRGSQT